MLRRAYIHEVWVARRPSAKFERHGVIRTKARFKKWLKEMFAEDPEVQIRFRLQESPNTTLYGVIPYSKRTGGMGLAFYAVDDEAM